jgi:FCP1-like phosphatase family protein
MSFTTFNSSLFSPLNMGDPMNSLSECSHPMRMGSLCAICGSEIQKEDILISALHNSDQLIITQDESTKINKKRHRRLLKKNKMILILDLDQTILHSAIDKESNCDFQFKIYSSTFYVKLRPFLEKFLKKISKRFEIHVYTMGTREYATEICSKIDVNGKYFGDRIVSRSENFNELQKSINRITSIHSNVVILDDRADVWDYTENLILIKPFWYHNEIDINDPSLINSQRIELADQTKHYAEEIDDNILLNVDEVSTIPNAAVGSSNGIILDEINNSIIIDGVISINNQLIPKDSRVTLEKTIEDDPNCVLGGSVSTDKCHLMAALHHQLVENNDLPVSLFEKDVIADGCSEDLVQIKQIVPDNDHDRWPPIDNELVHVMKILKKVHKKYFENKDKLTRNKKYVEATRLLKIKSMKRIKIASEMKNYDLIRFSGATFDMSTPSIVINSFELAEEFKVLNIDIKWLYECIYKRKAVPTGPYLISDHRIKKFL